MRRLLPTRRRLVGGACRPWTRSPPRCGAGLAVLADSPARFLAPAVLAAVRPDAEAAVRGEAAAAAVRDAGRRAGDGLPAAERRAPARAGVPRWPGRLVCAGRARARWSQPLARRRPRALRATSAAADRLRRGTSGGRPGLDGRPRRDAAGTPRPQPAGTRRSTRPMPRAALEVARGREGSLLRFLSGGWRRVKRGRRDRLRRRATRRGAADRAPRP